MSSWTEGYNADVVYVDHVYHELSPDYLAFTGLLAGVRPPRVDRPFRYCELGCGRGTGLIVAAATHANAQFVGVDFDPLHIAHARRTAEAAGIGNVAFREESFRDLAERIGGQPGGLPDEERFDFVVLHGVLSWIGAENRRAIATFLNGAVRPGGFVYVSYNSRTGWAPLIPLQRAMLSHVAANRKRGPQRIDDAMAFLDGLREAGAGYFAANPAAVQHLTTMLKQNRNYLAHEYLNDWWEAFDFADVAAMLEPAKLSFVGSATIPYIFDDLCIPPAMRERLAGIEDPSLIELSRDFATNRGFRRDLFVRGADRLSPAAHLDVMRTQRFTLQRPRDEAHLAFPIPLGEVRTDATVGEPILDALADARVSFGDLESLPALAGKPAQELIRCLALLVSSGQGNVINPDAEASAAGSQRLNRELGRRILLGDEIEAMAAPLTGGNVNLDPFERLALAGLFSGCPEDRSGLVAFLIERLQRDGIAIAGPDGLPMSDPQAIDARVAAIADVLLQRRLPLWRQLGIL